MNISYFIYIRVFFYDKIKLGNLIVTNNKNSISDFKDIWQTSLNLVFVCMSVMFFFRIEMLLLTNSNTRIDDFKLGKINFFIPCYNLTWHFLTSFQCTSSFQLLILLLSFRQGHYLKKGTIQI